MHSLKRLDRHPLPTDFPTSDHAPGRPWNPDDSGHLDHLPGMHEWLSMVRAKTDPWRVLRIPAGD
jgi:hypothetical protein